MGRKLKKFLYLTLVLFLSVSLVRAQVLQAIANSSTASASSTITRAQLVSNTNGGGGTTISVTTAATVVGNLIVVNWLGNAANGSTIGVSDSKGNTYTAFVGGWTATNCVTANCYDLTAGNSNQDSVLYYAVDAFGGVTSVTITNTVPSAYLVGVVGEYHSTTGWPVNPTDKTVTNPNYLVSSSTWNTGATPTTTQANELLFGIESVGGSGGGTLTVGGGWNSPLLVLATFYLVDDQMVSVTGTYSFTGTLGSAATNGSIIMTFKPN